MHFGDDCNRQQKKVFGIKSGGLVTRAGPITKLHGLLRCLPSCMLNSTKELIPNGLVGIAHKT